MLAEAMANPTISARPILVHAPNASAARRKAHARQNSAGFRTLSSDGDQALVAAQPNVRAVVTNGSSDETGGGEDEIEERRMSWQQ
jgi:hypothetical protein